MRVTQWIVVAIIGVLAVLAIFGVRKYLATSKTSEALNSLGAMNRMAVAAYNKESAPSELLLGSSSSGAAHQLCKTSTAVPAAIANVANKKYTADPNSGVDYHVNPTATDTGWVCLKYEMSEPQYFQYSYSKSATCGAGLAAPGSLAAGDWASCANGDLNGDGTVSRFGSTGKIVAGQAITNTEIATQDEEE